MCTVNYVQPLSWWALEANVARPSSAIVVSTWLKRAILSKTKNFFAPVSDLDSQCTAMHNFVLTMHSPPDHLWCHPAQGKVSSLLVNRDSKD